MSGILDEMFSPVPRYNPSAHVGAQRRPTVVGHLDVELEAMTYREAGYAALRDLSALHKHLKEVGTLEPEFVCQELEHICEKVSKAVYGLVAGQGGDR